MPERRSGANNKDSNYAKKQGQTWGRKPTKVERADRKSQVHSLLD